MPCLYASTSARPIIGAATIATRAIAERSGGNCRRSSHRNKCVYILTIARVCVYCASADRKGHYCSMAYAIQSTANTNTNTNTKENLPSTWWVTGTKKRLDVGDVVVCMDSILNAIKICKNVGRQGRGASRQRTRQNTGRGYNGGPGP
jgi:hypothetical protein